MPKSVAFEMSTSAPVMVVQQERREDVRFMARLDDHIVVTMKPSTTTLTPSISQLFANFSRLETTVVPPPTTAEDATATTVNTSGGSCHDCI